MGAIACAREAAITPSATVAQSTKKAAAKKPPAKKPAETAQLSWVDGRERTIKLADVGPVAFSEGMRMASSIYAARVVEKPEGT